MNGSSVEGLSIREVSYDEGGDVVDWSSQPAWVEGESIGELKTDLNEMLAALSEPVLDEAELDEKLGICPDCRHEGVKHKEGNES